MRRAIHLLLLLVVAGLGACSWSVFGDLADEAPATRIDQAGDIKSGAFGDGIVGLDRGADEGGALFLSGNGDPALATELIGKNGGVVSAAASGDNLKNQLDSPTRINGVARAPALTSGPAVYVASLAGGVGTVRVVDINRFTRGSNPIKALDTWTTKVADFGDSVVDGDFDGVGDRDDFAVGARDAVVVIKAVAGSWPQMDDSHPAVFTGGSFPGGDFTTIAAGELDGTAQGDELVAGAPEQNTVVVINRVKDCLDDSSHCTGFLTLSTPAGAKGFGGALLVADVDGDGKQEVVVGAPDSGQVFVYGVNDPFALELKKSLDGGGAQSFGSSLAYGRFTDGDGILAVGAPNAEVGGAAAAGKLLLYDKSLAALGGGVSLVSADASTLLGRHLGVLPFRIGAQTHEVLVASGRDAAFVFFSNLVPGHKDVRVR